MRHTFFDYYDISKLEKHHLHLVFLLSFNVNNKKKQKKKLIFFLQ